MMELTAKIYLYKDGKLDGNGLETRFNSDIGVF